MMIYAVIGALLVSAAMSAEDYCTTYKRGASIDSLSASEVFSAFDKLKSDITAKVEASRASYNTIYDTFLGQLNRDILAIKTRRGIYVNKVDAKYYEKCDETVEELVQRLSEKERTFDDCTNNLAPEHQSAAQRANDHISFMESELADRYKDLEKCKADNSKPTCAHDVFKTIVFISCPNARFIIARNSLAALKHTLPKDNSQRDACFDAFSSVLDEEEAKFDNFC